ncbi:MAG: hypothetical protein M3160_08155 [Candidatus Eremiobacteraeota bacterium]|nr:hypothetical protein [Candidatus Eremiobacteraeota bacterium]
MLHLADELLRRYCDEPDALLTTEKEHLISCERCRGIYDRIARNVKYARSLLGTSEPDLNCAVALQRARESRHLSLPAALEAPATTRSFALRGWHVAVAAALVLALTAGFSPLRTYAGSFLAIFEPHQFAPVALSRADMAQLRALPDLDAFGTTHAPNARLRVLTFTTPYDASRYARQRVLWPRYLPPQIPRNSTFRVSDARTASFTFEAAKARASARRNRAPLPTMPAKIDGSTLQSTIGPIVLSVYGTLPQSMRKRAEEVRAHRAERQMDVEHFSIPQDVVAIVQAPAPRVYSTGATVKEIEQYLLMQPGVPENLAAQIRSIGDPSTTLPIPIPVDRDIAHNVMVQGAAGVAVGDNTGMGAAVIWQRNGMVYGVMAPLTERQTMAIANSLGP